MGSESSLEGCLLWAEYTVESKPESISTYTIGTTLRRYCWSLHVWESKTVLDSMLFSYIMKVFFFGGEGGGGGVCLVLERSGLETVSGTLRQIQKKALLRQTMISKFKVQLELLSSPIKLFL